MIKVILWDVDGTLLDFKAAEKAAVKECFSLFELGECTDEAVARYSAINDIWWERLERKECTRAQTLVGRFRDFFEAEGLDSSIAEAFNEQYQSRLGDTICFCDNSFALLEKLKGSVLQCAVTNGTKVAQDKKLNKSGLIRLFDHIFISEDIGAVKPDTDFFEKVWSAIGRYGRDEVLIVGDSLTSDIKGGNNAGILSCWYNPKGAVNTKDARPDYEIGNLWQVEDILRERADN